MYGLYVFLEANMQQLTRTTLTRHIAMASLLRHLGRFNAMLLLLLLAMIPAAQIGILGLAAMGSGNGLGAVMAPLAALALMPVVSAGLRWLTRGVEAALSSFAVGMLLAGTFIAAGSIYMLADLAFLHAAMGLPLKYLDMLALMLNGMIIGLNVPILAGIARQLLGLGRVVYA
ncbi:MAG: hypothetical protein D6811_07995 [Alphaproteobacteria bacterium]|nr:MAG: hypothetical protein D6811_07995 [Alphaproteobacteria bacterium]